MPDKLVSPSSGLTDSKLSLANATPEDVRTGKTFYAGDNELKTGTNIIANVKQVVRLYASHYYGYDVKDNHWLVSIFKNGKFTYTLVKPGESYEDENFKVWATVITDHLAEGHFMPKVTVNAKYAESKRSFVDMTPTDRTFEAGTDYTIWTLHRFQEFVLIEFRL